MATSSPLDYPSFLSRLLHLNIPIFNLESHLSRYSGDDLIGHGNSTTVYKVPFYPIPTLNASPVALKVPTVRQNARSKTISTILEAFWKRIDILKRFDSHPNIINLYGVAFTEDKPIPMLVLELAFSNLTDYLQERAEDGTRVSWAAKRRFCGDIADALDALHSANIVHGGIEGDSILLFGKMDDEANIIAKISAFGQWPTDGSFDAPECTAGAPLSIVEWRGKSMKDNYSYGLVVWQIAKDGEKPFQGMTRADIEGLKHSDRDLRTLQEELGDDTPEAFWKVITDMSRYEPQERGDLAFVREIMMVGNKNCLDSDPSEIKVLLGDCERHIPINEMGLELNSIRLISIPLAIEAQITRSYEERASKGDNPQAAYDISQCYRVGFGVTFDKEKMISWAIKAAELGSMLAIYNIATRYDILSDLRDHVSSLFPWLLKAAQLGHERSMLQVSRCYELGVGVEKDEFKASKWMRLYDPSISSPSPISPDSTYEKALKMKSILERKRAERLDGMIVDHEWASFHLAAIRGDVYGLKLLALVEKMGVKIRDGDGWTPLHRAALHGRIKMMRTLVKDFEADVNDKSANGMTPLHLAAMGKSVDTIEVLINELGADQKLEDNEGNTPLQCAVALKNVPALYTFCGVNGNDPNAKGKAGRAPLLLAAEMGQIEEIKVLLRELGVDINVKDGGDSTALHYAASKGHVEVVRMLANEFGMEVNAKDRGGYTPLHYATFHGFVKVTRLLVNELGADIMAKDIDGKTPLDFARENQIDEIVEICSSP